MAARKPSFYFAVCGVKGRNGVQRNIAEVFGYGAPHADIFYRELYFAVIERNSQRGAVKFVIAIYCGNSSPESE